MKLILKNICAIREAEVSINGLTIIAGENNTGKSTVGRMLYSIVKTINNYEAQYYIINLNNLKMILRECQHILSDNTDSMKSAYNRYQVRILEQLRDKLRAISIYIYKLQNRQEKHCISVEKVKKIETEVSNLIFEMIVLYQLDNKNAKGTAKKENNIWQNIKHVYSEFFDMIFQSRDYDLYDLSEKEFNSGIVQEYIKRNGNMLLLDKELNYENQNRVYNLILLCLKIHNNITKPLDKMEAVHAPLYTTLKAEFLSGISSKKELICSVTLEDNFQQKFSFEVENGDIRTREIMDNFIYSDITYIETPIVLYFNEYEAMELKNAPQHLSDLLYKLSNKNTTSKYENSQEISKLAKVIEGNFRYDEGNDSFIYQNNNNTYAMTNVANGTKSFGNLQMLHQNGWILSDNIIIIDEPEIHLHPKWQIQYCKIITELVKNGMKFVITTHSPYVVQALKKYSEDADITKDVNFYLSEQQEDGVVIQDKTKKLGDIYEKLTAPLREIM